MPRPPAAPSAAYPFVHCGRSRVQIDGPRRTNCPRCNRLRQRRTLSLRDRLQAAPERIFERDAGLVAIDHDGAFDDL